jgi:hypothetical protein
MLIMIKKTIITTTTFLFIIFGIHVYAGQIIGQQEFKQKMNAHIEKMKIKNPQKYQEMIQRAGENVMNCCSCHLEIKACKGKLPAMKGINSSGGK